MSYRGFMGLALTGLGIVAGCDELAADAGDGPRAAVVAADEGPGAEVIGWDEPPCRPGQIRCEGECVEPSRVAGPGLESRTFEFTGAPQRFVVPECVATLTVELWGAQGGGSRCCDIDGGALQDDGGRGAYVRGEIAVEPGEELRIFVGGHGDVDGAPGWNGGGVGGEFAGGGGGASDVRRGGAGLADRILVAGGGGGGQCGCPDHGAGGPGGLLLGGAGESFYPQWDPAGGGTQLAGGLAGTLPGTAGALGLGGGAPEYHVAGGGGGWYGGGSAYAAGGGGGSSRIAGDLLAGALPGVRVGDGLVRVTW